MKTIRSQMLKYLVTFFVVVFILFGFFLMRQLNTLPKYIEHQNQEIASSKAAEVSKEILGYRDAVEMIASSNIIKNGDMDEIKEFLPTVVLENRFRNMTISDSEGNAWTTYDMDIDISDQDQFYYIVNQGEDYHISDPFESPFIEEDIPIITVSHAIKDDQGQTIGLLNAVISTIFLDDIIDAVEYQDTGYAYILNKEGYVVSYPDDERTIESHISEWVESFDQQFFSNEKGSFTFTNSNHDEELVVFSDIEGLDGWIFVLSVSYDEAFAIYYNTVTFFQIAAIILIIVIIIFSTLYAKTISTPISRLVQTFEKAAEGNLDIEANENYTNEVGRAGISFNTMIKKIKQLTYRDTITGLYNLNSFILEVNQAINKLNRTSDKGVIVIVSIDDFKRINTIAGYEIGNQVLKTFSQKILTYISKEDLVGRYFGDEIIVYLKASNHSSLPKKIDGLKKIVSEPLQVDNVTYQINSSIGVRHITKAVPIDALIHQATIAKLHAKTQSGTDIKYYNQQMDYELTNQQNMEEALFHALSNKEFYLVYQPIMKDTLDNLVGFEVLLRWDHSEYKEVPINECIKILERKGLIIELGNWIIQNAIAQLNDWNQRSEKQLFISINISALQLEDNTLYQTLEEMINSYEIDPALIHIEITESYIISLYNQKTNILNDIRSLGCKISIDDFGTGYSSLSYLVNLPINTIKIDREFINNLHNTEKDRIVVETMTYLANKMNFMVIAEGIEDNIQYKFLKSLSCGYFQGYYISRPIDPQAIERQFLNIN